MLVYVAIQLISTSVSCFHRGLKVHSIDLINPIKNVKYVIERWQIRSVVAGSYEER